MSRATEDRSGRRIGEAGLNLDDLRYRLSAGARRAGLGEVGQLHRVHGGGSGITFRADTVREGTPQPVVIKVAPPGLPPTMHRDVLRQARVLTALGGAPGTRAPRVLFTDPGRPPGIPPLFAMSWEPGDSVEPIFAQGELPSPGTIGGRLRSAAEVLAALHRLRPESIGLAAEQPVSLPAELERWRSALVTVEGRLRGRADEAAGMLSRWMPDPVLGTLVHGDYRLGNILCHDGAVTAVIDWELWAVSDPRLDLGWFLLHHDRAGNPHQGRPAPGMPPMAELIAVYQDTVGQTVECLWWFEAMARYKQAAAGALLLKRSPLPADDPSVAEGARKLRTEINDAISIVSRAAGPAGSPG